MKNYFQYSQFSYSMQKNNMGQLSTATEFQLTTVMKLLLM